MTARRPKTDERSSSPGVAGRARSEETFFRALFEASADGLVVVDGVGRIVHVNRRLEELSGYRRRELLGRPIEILVPDEARTQHERERRWYLKAPRTRHMGLGLPLFLRRRDGTRVPVDVGLAPMRSLEGDLVVAAVRDDAARRRAEDRLRTLEERLRVLVERSPAITHVSRPDRTSSTIYISPQVERILGYAPAEWEADDELWVKLLHPEDSETVLAANERLITRGEPMALDYRMVARDGRVVWIHEETEVIRDEAGAPLFCQGLMLDITQRKVAEEAVRESERRLAEAQRIAHLGSWEWDVYRNDIAWSEEVYRIFGLSPDRGPLSYEGFLGTVHPEDREVVDAAVRAALEEGSAYAVDHRIVRPDGSQRVVHEQGVVERDGQGRPVRMAGTVLDITERRRMEQELELQFERLRKLDAERRRLLEHLIRAREEEAARIAGDIHDDPLQKMAALALRVSLLRERARDPESLRQLETIQGTVAQVIGSLRTLLFELRPQVLDRDGLAAALRELLGRATQDRPLAWEVADRMTEEPPLTNVLKHARASHVEVLLETEGTGTKVRVLDDGVGFDPEQLAPMPGHLGLSDMRERAELAGGWLTVTSARGRGTSVEFWVPFHPTRSDERV